MSLLWRSDASHGHKEPLEVLFPSSLRQDEEEGRLHTVQPTGSRQILESVSVISIAYSFFFCTLMYMI